MIDVGKGNLCLIPIFYKVSTDDVNMFNGTFGEGFLETLKIQGIRDHPFAEHWMRNVNFICTDTGFISEDYSNDTYLVDEIVRAIQRRLQGKTLPRHVQDEDLTELS
ncbi:putative disease resistance protein [Cardamine amara subsp. amara]|uniref:Disease resistance protein n=1 Tax=Cardamine amara subsp. amara TaxID=228776 RepID=A0ABD0ZSK7_CARAN